MKKPAKNKIKLTKSIVKARESAAKVVDVQIKISQMRLRTLQSRYGDADNDVLIVKAVNEVACLQTQDLMKKYKLMAV